MKLSTAVAYSVSVLSLTSTVALKNSSLRGHDLGLGDPFDELKCSFEGKNDEGMCSTAVTADDNPCSFCKITANGEESGLCVDPQVAEQMKQMNHDVSCSNTDLEISHVSKLGFSPAYASTVVKRIENDEEGFSGPFDQLKCSFEGKADEGKCSTSVTADGQPCAYCSLSENGEESGLCVDPQVAEQMEQMDHDISCSNDTFITKKGLEKREHTQGSLSGPFDQLKCLFEGRTDEGMCSTSVNADDNPCSFCNMNGEESGLCVDPQVAEQMKQMNPGISCSNTELLSVNFDRDSFKCTTEAVNDADKCSSTTTADQQGCEYCTMDGPFGEQGICVSPDHAEKLQGLAGDKISCISHNGVTFNQPLSSSPIKDCNLDGIDHETCLDPSKVNGSECIWCDAGIGGFCFPKSWQETAGRFLTCGDSKVPEEKAESEANEKLDIDPSVLKSSCFKVGLHGGSPDDCRDAVDDASGDHCIVCNAPGLGGIGLCMPPTYKGTEGSFYTCDMASDSIFAQE